MVTASQLRKNWSFINGENHSPAVHRKASLFVRTLVLIKGKGTEDESAPVKHALFAHNNLMPVINECVSEQLRGFVF